MIALTGMFRLRVVVVFLTTTLLTAIMLGWIYQSFF
jgi:hypothetical protein